MTDPKLELDEAKAEKFHACKKGYFLTYPQCSLTRSDLGDHLLSLGPEIVVVSQEKHKSGDLHLHAWCEWTKPKNVKRADFFDYKGFHCNIGSTKKKKCNTRANALKYILKSDEEPWSFGIDLEAWKAAEKKHRSMIGEMLITGKKTVREIVAEYPAEIYNLDKLLRNVNLYKVLNKEVPMMIPRKNYWIVGDPGVGKSYAVRSIYNMDELFMKSANKWWDGYAGQNAVLLDDLGPEHKMLSYYIKIWADNYSFNAEIKGGMIVPYYTSLYVTSNYKPYEIWKEDSDAVLVSAIERRFEIKEIFGRETQRQLIAEILGLDYVYETFKRLAVYKSE